MAGIMNNTSRQYNLKCITKDGNRVVVRLAPGFNVVKDEHWLAFVPKGGKGIDPFVKELKKDGNISFGKDFDDMELERDADTVSKSKSEPLVKMKSELDASRNETKEATAKAEKAESEASEAKARAEIAELELEKLRKETAGGDVNPSTESKDESKDKTEEES